MVLILDLAVAGMPAVRLTSLASERLEVVSFFLLVLLVAALVVRQLWNRLTPWPRLGYRRALGLTVLWALLFHLVLTMISGARELLTPGAWSRDGATHALTSDVVLGEQVLAARRARLEMLRDALWTYAVEHEGAFPADEYEQDMAAEAWQTLHPTGMRFVYLPGRTADVGQEVVAYEPGVYGEERWVLRSHGGVELQPVGAIFP